MKTGDGSKFVQIIVAIVPTAPLVGEKLETAKRVTTNFVADMPVSELCVMAIGPVVAPSGMVVIISVSVELVTTALVPLNVTVLLLGVMEKLAPTIITGVPTGPLAGEKLVMMGVFASPPQPVSANATRKFAMMKSCRMLNMG